MENIIIKTSYNKILEIQIISYDGHVIGIVKKIQDRMRAEESDEVAESSPAYGKRPSDILKLIKKLEKEMKQAAKKLNFEKAAELRDEILYWKRTDLGL